MKVYCGIDLHSTNNYLVILDDDRQIVLSRKLPNCLETILDCLHPYRSGSRSRNARHQRTGLSIPLRT